MGKLFKNKIFILGFLGSAVLSVVFNCLDFVLPAKLFKCSDCLIRFGFPFYFYEKGGFFDVNQFIWSGLIGNILITIIFSFVVGLIFKFIWEKFTTKKLR